MGAFYRTRDESRVGRLLNGAYTSNTDTEAIAPTRDEVYIPCEGEGTSRKGEWVLYSIHRSIRTSRYPDQLLIGAERSILFSEALAQADLFIRAGIRF